MFLWKCVLKIYSKFTEEHPCRSVISINLLCKFIKIALRHGRFPVNLSEHLWRTASDEKHCKSRYPHTIYFLSEIYDCIHTIFIFQHEKQNEKCIFISFTLRVYCLKWTIKRSNFYEGLMTCRFKYNFDWLESDEIKFDWRKYKIHLDEYIRHHWSKFRCWKICSKSRKYPIKNKGICEQGHLWPPDFKEHPKKTAPNSTC